MLVVQKNWNGSVSHASNTHKTVLLRYRFMASRVVRVMRPMPNPCPKCGEWVCEHKANKKTTRCVLNEIARQLKAKREWESAMKNSPK